MKGLLCALCQLVIGAMEGYIPYALESLQLPGQQSQGGNDFTPGALSLFSNDVRALDVTI